VRQLVADLFRSGSGVLLRREHPELADTVRRLAIKGDVVAVLPGVYLPAAVAGDWRMRAVAACRWDVDAVLTGETAAALTFWPELLPGAVDVANRRAQFSRSGFRFERRRVPIECQQVAGVLRMTTPALTALDLVERHGGDAIDRALRSRTTTLAAMSAALSATPTRRGNRDRRRMLLDSRDEPWSAAERLAHRVFRGAGLTGWRTNVPVRCGDRRYFLDIVFAKERLVVEVDGRIHLSPALFESDRRRGNDLLMAGWRVIHVTWQMLTDEPDRVVAMIRRALREPARPIRWAHPA
jgi:very-short-patch-repair endonuclease